MSNQVSSRTTAKTHGPMRAPTTQVGVQESPAPLAYPGLSARMATPQRLLPTDVLTLQRTIGNRAVVNLLQRQPSDSSSPMPRVSTSAVASPRIQRLTARQESTLQNKIGQYKFNKAKAAGKLDVLFAKSNQELQALKLMPRDDFDTMLGTLASTSPGGTNSTSTVTGSPTSGTTTPQSTTQSTPQSTPPTTTPQGKIAWLFEKVRNGAIAFVNSSKFAFDTETLLPKLAKGLSGKLAGEITSESLKLELTGLQIPFSTLASTEIDMKMAAKLAEQEAQPTTLTDRLSGLGGKAIEGAELGDLADSTLGMKSTQETGFSFSPTKLFSELNAPEKNLKLAHNPSATQGGTPAPGIEFAGEGSVSAKLRLLFGQLRDLAERYIGNPLRELELKVKEYVLNVDPEDTSQEQSTLGWLIGSTGSMLSSIGSGILSGLSRTDDMLGGYGKSVARTAYSWSTWATGYIPEWVRSWMPTFNKEGLRAWFEDRTKFIEKLDPNQAMPKLGGYVDTKGTYVGNLQAEDLETDVGVDLNIPESYLATWAKEIQDRFLPESGLAQMLAASLGGKLSIFKLRGYAFSRAKGFRGLIPSLNLGPGLGALWSLVTRATTFAKQTAGALFRAIFT